MDPLAAIPAVAPSPPIPAAWIASGAVTPVHPGGAAVAAPTTWAPQPAVDAGAIGSSGTMLDAIANAMIGIAPPAAQAAEARQQLAMQAAVATQSAPAAGPSLEVPGDPTLVSSVGGALAGFASATGRAVNAAADVAGAGVSKARQAGTELWAGIRNPRQVHVSQVPSKYNAAPAAGNRDCGPASVVMTLKLLGKSIPGAAANAAPQRLINRVRQLAGNAANTVSTTNHELGRALQAAGTKTREIADALSIRRAVMAGKPVILNGNPRHPGSYGRSFSSKQMTPYDGAHWIVVSGYDSKAGKFIINDPLSKVGPVKVSPAQLEAYRGGSLGIEVTG